MYAKKQDKNVLSASVKTKLPQPRISFGVVIDDYANQFNTLSSLETNLNRAITLISIFKQFGNKNNSEFKATDLAYAKTTGKTVLIAWEPWNPDEGMAQSKNYLQSITSGAEDAYIRRFATSIRTYKGPIILRFGHEMNGNWYPWGGQPEVYREAYKRIVSVFRQEKVTNVQWMWSIKADNVPFSPIETVSQYYPGDELVDQIGLDGFNFGTAKGSDLKADSWRSFAEIFLPAYRFVARYKKPISISEVASAEEGGNKAEWVKTMLQADLPRMPMVTSLVWFDLLKERDWRIDSSKSSLTAFKESL